MTDHTRSDIRLGDLSALDPAATEASGPGVSSTADITTTQLPVGGPPRRPPPAPVPASRPPTLVLVLAGVVAVLAGAVIFLVIGQRDLTRAIAVLDARAQASVETLADRVSSTNTTLKSTDSETQKSLNVLAADIGKLDGGIARLNKALEQQVRQQADTAAEIKALAAELHRTVQADGQADAQRDARLKTLADSLDAAAARQKTLADSVARLERSGDVAQLRSEVAVLGASLREMQDDYDRRLKATEQATASSDAFRRQVNATIDRLNQQVGELYQRR